MPAANLTQIYRAIVFPWIPFYSEGGGIMQESEVKRVKGKNNKIPRDPSMKGGARGGDKAANAKAPENEEPPIIQRYSE